VQFRKPLDYPYCRRFYPNILGILLFLRYKTYSEKLFPTNKKSYRMIDQIITVEPLYFLVTNFRDESNFKKAAKFT